LGSLVKENNAIWKEGGPGTGVKRMRVEPGCKEKSSNCTGFNHREKVRRGEKRIKEVEKL